ncbi:hypothetical protein [Olivibacter sitiensis]|uniref:hypothetical protein n=1 Tax=Olivibacter sitiensis TaxID=376470 RepID=UPI0012F8BD34|nr:hypothetical protein [Olivibacter sitiensis]
MKVLKLRTLLVLLALVTCAWAGCKTSQQGQSDSPSARQWRNAVKGQWVLDEVGQQAFPKGASVSRIFDEAPIECFIGSTWNLISNGRGGITFTANGDVCAPGATRDIFWSVFDGDGQDVQFQFKKLYPGEKASQVKEGYRLVLDYADAQSLTMLMPVNIAGAKDAYLVFKFSR